MRPPKKWKMAVLIWIAIYPTITLLFIIFRDILAQIHFIALRTLIVTLVVVTLMVFVITPSLQYLMADWLKK